jgi:hypothetical protein
MRERRQASKISISFSAMAFLVGWSSHGLYQQHGAAPDGSLEAHLLNAPIVVAQTVYKAAQSIVYWVGEGIDVLTMLIGVLKQIF